MEAKRTTPYTAPNHDAETARLQAAVVPGFTKFMRILYDFESHVLAQEECAGCTTAWECERALILVRLPAKPDPAYLPLFFLKGGV